MLRLTCRAINLLNKLSETITRICIDQRNYRALIRLPTQFVSAAFYSKNVQQINTIKPPLASSIVKEINQSQQQDERKKSSTRENKVKSWRNMKYTLIIFGVIFATTGLYIILELGGPKYNDAGNMVTDQFSNMSLLKQYVLRTIHEINYYGELLKEPYRDQLLPDMVCHPLYHPKYTLVLEFTDVLVHPEWTYGIGWRFKKRPGIDYFLESLHGEYEIVVYTAEEGMTVFPIMDAIDPRSLINHKLVRDATFRINGRYLKDLDKLNRDLNKVIVVDWNGDCTNGHDDNVLRIQRWPGNDEDETLYTLSSFLIAIANSQVDDVREVLRVYNQYSDPLAVYKERQKKLIEKAEADAEEERSLVANTSAINHWKLSLFKTSF